MSPVNLWDYDPVYDLRPGDPAYIASTCCQPIFPSIRRGRTLSGMNRERLTGRRWRELVRRHDSADEVRDEAKAAGYHCIETTVMATIVRPFWESETAGRLPLNGNNS